jgi:hypothetical protein
VRLNKLFLVGAAFLATQAYADQVKTFTWVQPTQYTDGSSLPVAQIAGYTLACTPGTISVPVPTGTTFQRSFTPGNWSCNLSTRATNGQVSAPSGNVTFTVAQPVPAAPSGFSVD